MRTETEKSREITTERPDRRRSRFTSSAWPIRAIGAIHNLMACGFRPPSFSSALPRGLVLLLGAWLAAPTDSLAAIRLGRSSQPNPSAPDSAAVSARTSFAPVPGDHALANIWNDPEFTRRLIGSYGFLSEAEPRLNAEEQQFYTETIVPLLRENPEQAIPALEGRIKPDASAVFDYTLATIHFQNGDLTKAVKHYEQSLAKFPDYRRAQKNLALALVRDGKFEEAIEPLARTISLGAGDGKIFGLLGYACMNQANFLSALAAYKHSMLYEPANLDFKLGVVKCQIALAEYPPALALLDELLQKYPDRENLWSLQASVFIQTEQYGKAIVNFEILRKLGKATAQNLMALGDLYVAQDARDLALSAYLEAIQGEPDRARSLRAAEILTSRGAWNEATQLMAKIRETSGADLSREDEMKLLKLEAKVALANGKGGQAIKVFEQIIERNPLDGEALILAGDYYGKNGEREKAGFRYETAAKITGFEADALLKQAQLHVQGQKYVRAVELLRQAQKIKPRENVQRYLEKVEQVALHSKS